MSKSDDERVIELAEKNEHFFVSKSRKKEGDDSEYTSLADDAPEWLRDIVHDAHESMLPDDWKHEFISDAFDAIAGGEPGDLDSPELEADIYNHDLLRWLSSNLNRISFVDEAIEEYGDVTGIM